jgi:hypothetical protein
VFVEISREVNGKSKCNERRVIVIRYDSCGKLAGWRNYTGYLSGLPLFLNFWEADIPERRRQNREKERANQFIQVC